MIRSGDCVRCGGLDHAFALHLYRILPKALINTNKHTRAREGIVSMNRNPGGMILLIAGDGMALSDSAAAGIGTRFHIIQNRARSIGAKSIQDRWGGGTEIICVLPEE